MDRRKFLKQGTIAATVLSASPRNLLGGIREPVREGLKTVAEIDQALVRKFASRLRGPALLPGHPGYESACQLWTGRILKRPGLVVRCATTQDIATTVKFAREEGLLLAIRGGGHTTHATCEGGLLINLSDLDKIEVNSSKRIIRVQAGPTVGDIDRATSPHKLAAVLGECPSVGISGYILGGGLGRLTGQYGALCDDLISAEVVTADGQVRRASADENSDLFWAIRGGGGNFGIATSFEFKLHPVGPVLSGMLRYPISEARALLRFFADFMASAPETLDALIEIGSNILQYAPDAQSPTVVINVCCSGDLRAAEKALQSLRAFRRPIMDTIRPMSYLAAQGLGDVTPLINHAPPRFARYAQSGFLARLGEEAIDLIVAHCEKPPSAFWSVALDHYMHGAVCRVPESEMAFSLRRNGYSLRTTTFQAGEGPPDKVTAWVKSLNGALNAFSGGRMYMNYLTDQGEPGVRAAFGGNYARLATLKKKYDPTNFFHLNQNIGPA
jgi:FAD/FMN-containing dehydrogenase